MWRGSFHLLARRRMFNKFRGELASALAQLLKGEKKGEMF